jgi:hypothetical protein
MSSLSIFFVILAAYLVVVYLMYRDVVPPSWGLMVIPILLLFVVDMMKPGTVSKADFFNIFNGGTRTAGAMISFIFAGLFARAQIETGIVENIVKRAAELGGDRPFVVALILGFASAYSTLGAFNGGALTAHAIALPILISMGLSPLTAAVIQGFGCLQFILFWPFRWAYFSTVTKVTLVQAMPFLLIFTPIICLTWIGFVIYQFKVNKLPIRWSAPKESLTKVEKKVPLYALLCPLLPLLFIIVFKTPDILAFILSALIAVLVTQRGSGRKLSEMPGFLTKVFLLGINDVNYNICLFIGIGFILQAADFPFMKAIFGESLKTILPSSPIFFILFFSGFIGICALFRGPAQPWAMGAAVFASITGVGIYPALVPGLLIAVADVFSIVADVTSGYTMYICALAKISIVEFLKKVYVSTLIYMVIGIILITIYCRMW